MCPSPATPLLTPADGESADLEGLIDAPVLEMLGFDFPPGLGVIARVAWGTIARIRGSRIIGTRIIGTRIVALVD